MRDNNKLRRDYIRERSSANTTEDFSVDKKVENDKSILELEKKRKKHITTLVDNEKLSWEDASKKSLEIMPDAQLESTIFENQEEDDSIEDELDDNQIQELRDKGYKVSEIN
jgi:hypothetical protein